jgi:O-antigen/teichoic acid export membrane protein
MAEADLKLRTARTLKWNVIDKVSSQVLYAVTGIVLARVLDPEDFGLVGAVLVFQAFASLFVDSGFSAALIQRKAPTETDYTTVFWFNMGMATLLYAVLWPCAPYIADLFQGDQRIVPLARVMFLTFILNASAIVQTNRLMKRMDVRMVAVSNVVGLVVSGIVGIGLALAGVGAWAIVWQSITLAAVKSLVLWTTGHWWPSLQFSWRALQSFFRVGSGIMVSSFLNVVFQNIYSFFVGNKVGLAGLGYYTQADKWSKMGISSLSQVLTSSFLPVLSQFQDDRQRFANAMGKMNRFTAYLLFPSFALLMLMTEPLFHLLFGDKWDASILLFQLLMLRGVFTVLTSLYNNYILSLGRAALMVYTEVLRDGLALVAIFITLPYIVISYPTDVTYGIRIMLYGQLLASAVTWIATLVIVVKVGGRSLWLSILDLVPYLLEACAATGLAWVAVQRISMPIAVMAVEIAVVAVAYVGMNYILKSRIQIEALQYLFGRFMRKKDVA